MSLKKIPCNNFYPERYSNSAFDDLSNRSNSFLEQLKKTLLVSNNEVRLTFQKRLIFRKNEVECGTFDFVSCSYNAKCSSQTGLRVSILTEVLYRLEVFDAMYRVTKGSLRPFESLGTKSLASITSTFRRNAGASLCSTSTSSSLCLSFDILNASWM